MRGALLLLVLAVPAQAAAAAAAPQEPDRRPLLGVVTRPDGEPLAGAAVTLVGQRDLGAAPTGDAAADVVRATADARGRFRADLVVGLPYAGWATAAGDEPGVRFATGLHGWFGAGAVVSWATRRAPTPRVHELAGGAAWQDRAPLQWVAFPTPMLRPALPIAVEAGDGDDVVRGRLPALPVGGGRWGVLDRAGELLFCAHLDAGAPDVLTLPPPRDVPVVVRAASGAPIAGAALRARVARRYDEPIDGFSTGRSWWCRPVGVTDAEGHATVRLPLAAAPFESEALDVLLAARAAGHVETVSGFARQHLFVDDRRVLPAGARALSFTLPASAPLEGAVQVAGAPRGGLRARLVAIAKLHTSTSGYAHDERQFDAAVGDDGRFAFTAAPGDLHGCRLLLFAAGDRAPLCQLPMQSGRRLPATPIDLVNVATLALRLLDERRGPAAGRVGYVRPVEPDPVARRGLVRFCTDSAGRAELRLWPGSYYVYSCDAAGWCFARLRLEPGTNESVLEPAPLQRCRGVLRDAAGAPVGGARLQLQQFSTRVRGDPDRAVMLEVARAHFRRAAPACRTDAAGEFAFAFPGVDDLVLGVAFASARGRTEQFDPAADDYHELVAR